jgi:hypothetical protein
MPFKPWIRNISPLAWMLGASCAANVITMVLVAYVAFGVPKVEVDRGYVHVSGEVRVEEPRSAREVSVRGKVDIDDRVPVRVEVIK